MDSSGSLVSVVSATRGVRKGCLINDRRPDGLLYSGADTDHTAHRERLMGDLHRVWQKITFGKSTQKHARRPLSRRREWNSRFHAHPFSLLPEHLAGFHVTDIFEKESQLLALCPRQTKIFAERAGFPERERGLPHVEGRAKL